MDNAFSDGGDRKEINASLKGRDAKLLVKISPPILTSESIQDASILFRLYDVTTNQTIKFTSLFLSVKKDGRELLHPDLYHSREGILRLSIQPSPGETVIYANKEPHLDAWEADQGGVIKLKAPILLEGGLYQIHVEVFGIDSPLNIFPQDEIPKFDVYLSVGDIYHQVVQSNDRSYNVTVISYYDKVQDFSFDSGKQEIDWSMPFNYNLTRIENEPDIFIHEEVRIPWSFVQIANYTFFVGSVDGKALLPSSLVMDPYSSESDLIIHFLINKNQILQVVKQSSQLNEQGAMKFALSPGKASEVQTSTRVPTDRGNLMVILTWNPGQLSANTPTELKLKFYDQFTEQPISGNVSYDFTVFQPSIPERLPIISKLNNNAENGTDALDQISFPANATYPLQVRVNGISVSSAGADTSPDTSRAGIAVGVVVVPEFETLAGLVMAISVFGIIVVQKRIRNGKL